MGIHITEYKTENGKTHKVETPAAQQAGKNETQGKPGPDGKNGPAEPPAKQGA